MNALKENRSATVAKTIPAAGMRATPCLVMVVLLTLFVVMPPTQTVYAYASDYEPSVDAVGQAASDNVGVSFAPGEAIACVKAGYEGNLAGIADAIEPLLILEGSPSGSGARELVLVTSSTLSADELLAALRECEGVEFVEPNYEASLSLELTGDAPLDESLSLAAEAETPSHDYTSRQYAFNGEFGIDVPQWNTYDAQGSPTPIVSAQGQVVAVLDTGVDYNHSDLRNVMWSEGLSYPSLVALGGGVCGINVAPPRADGTYYDTAEPMDDGAHGTHVAGIIAGEWNGFGISGAASGARLMVVKTMNDVGAMGIDEALRGYRYVIAALRAGVPVAAINNSWGDNLYSRALDLAVYEAGTLGAVTVFAAGNERADIDMADQVANSFANNPYAVVVGNSDRQGAKSESSCFGKRSVDVFAPGQDILSTMVTGTGPGDDAADPLVTDGTTYSSDFESAAVEGNVENGVFGFKAADNTSIAIAPEGHGSSQSLSLSKTGTNDSVAIVSKQINAGGECRGLTFWAKSPSAGVVDVMLVYNTSDGLSEEQRTKTTGDGWQAIALPIGAKAVKDNLQLDLSFTFEMEEAQEEGVPSAGSILVDNVKLVAETSPYDFMTGTSQSAPAVAGGAAVLAAAFPEDDAAIRAARITGSVKPVDTLADQCVSGGVFSLRKALAGDTAPVLQGASTSGSAVTVEGFFFGPEQGTLTVDGEQLVVTAWSDTTVIARLPSGFVGGDKLVELTRVDGGKGHQRLRIGTPASLYQRLPLPGRALSGDPGEYEVTSHEFDEAFYAAMPRALVGLGGNLYYILETTKETTAIYRYDIDGQTWELAYEGGYAAGGGACTWDGKILFVAGQREENKTYFGLFDPTTNDVKYTPYSSESFERGCTLVNTGKGVLLAGGTKNVYGSIKLPSIEIVRTVDLATMTVSQVEMPGETGLLDSWYAGAYDEQGRGYLFCGTSMKGMYRFSFVDGKASCEVLEEGSVSDERDDNAQAVSAQAEGSAADDQTKRMVAGSTKGGVVASGPAMVGDSGVVRADTYSLEWGQTKFRATDKLVSVTKMYNQVGTAYRGSFYVIADTDSETGGKVFATQLVETIDQPGDVTRSDSPAEAGGSKAEESKPKGSNATVPASKLPSTGDALVSPVPFLVVAIAAILYLLRRSGQLRAS